MVEGAGKEGAHLEVVVIPNASLKTEGPFGVKPRLFGGIGPVNYFRASSAERKFRDYKELCLEYWGARPEDHRDFTDIHFGSPRPETEASAILREQVNTVFPQVNQFAHELGQGVVLQSIPPPMVGGAVIPVNLLASVLNQHMGHSFVSEQMILDTIDRCIGAARIAKREGLIRLVFPAYWLIDIPAVIVRLPFLILRQAGLPAKVEENIIAQVTKSILVALLMIVAAYLGIEAALPSLLR